MAKRNRLAGNAKRWKRKGGCRGVWLKAAEAEYDAEEAAYRDRVLAIATADWSVGRQDLRELARAMARPAR